MSDGLLDIERLEAQAEADAASVHEALAPKPPSLREKLSRVAAHCAYVQKGGVNEFHGYPYAMASQVFAKVNEALIENRLTSVPRFSIASVEGPLVTVKCTLLLFDIDAPEEKEAGVLVKAYGSGMDKGDKAIMKAQTAALKYAWMMLLNISTGDDPEADSTTDSRAHGEPVKPRQTPEQYAERVQRNKTAPLSPLAVKLSEQLNKELAEEMPKGTWPEAPPEGMSHFENFLASEPHVVLEPVCECGSPLIQKTIKGEEKLFCKLADMASSYEYSVKTAKPPLRGTREAFKMLEDLHKKTGFDPKKHVKFRPIP